MVLQAHARAPREPRDGLAAGIVKADRKLPRRFERVGGVDLDFAGKRPKRREPLQRVVFGEPEGIVLTEDNLRVSNIKDHARIPRFCGPGGA